MKVEFKDLEDELRDAANKKDVTYDEITRDFMSQKNEAITDVKMSDLLPISVTMAENQDLVRKFLMEEDAENCRMKLDEVKKSLVEFNGEIPNTPVTLHL